GAPAPQVEVSASDLHAPKVEVKDATVQRDPPRVLLVGDSLANSLAPGFQRLADQQGWVLWNASVPGCGLADEGEYWIGIWQSQSDKCKPEWRQRWPAHIATFDPDVVVVLLGGHDTTDRLINGHVIKYDTPEGAQLEASDVRTAVKILSSQGARVVWLTLPYNKQGWAQK